MMVVISNGEHCCQLFELFHKGSIQSQSQKLDLWIKFITGPIIPSCRSWLLKIIPLPFAVRSKFSIHILLVCAMPGGEIRISVRSFFYLNYFFLDKRSGNWLEQIVSFSVTIFNLRSVENRVKRTFYSPMSPLIFRDKSL